MFDPRPFGLHVKNGELTDNDNAFIHNTAKRLTNLKELSGVSSLKMVYDLPDGGHAIFQDMGGTFRVITDKTIIVENTERVLFAKQGYIPMLYSGVIDQGLIVKNSITLTITEQTRRRLNNYQTSALPPKQLTLQKFAVEYAPKFAEFTINDTNGVRWSQYTQQKATWYSGAMAEVMQIVGGYGKQISIVSDDSIMSVYENARYLLPQATYHAIVNEISEWQLPAYTGMPNKDGQYEYNYKFNETHGVSFDNEGKPWLLMVKASGLWAMPLPLVPATTTQAFKDYVEQVNDTELLSIIERFGGMPSGESFPDGSAFYDWQRAGVIIRLCDTQNFYESNEPYSSALGWSFNKSGSEAINTCFHDDGNTLTGFAYQLNIRLGSAKNQGRVMINVDLPNDTTRAYLSQLFIATIDPTHANLAIRYKIARMDKDELIAIASKPYSDNELIYWQNLTMPPIANHSASMTLLNQGEVLSTPNIKVPEPIVNGCISLPVPIRPIVSSKIDTVVLACFIGDDLRVVKQFYDNREQPISTQGDFEDVMIIGEWWQKTTIGNSRIIGDLYINGKDDRDMAAPAEKTTNIKGWDLGYTRPSFTMDFYFWRTGDLFRDRYFAHKINTQTVYDKTIALACLIPYFCRNALVYGAQKTSGIIEKNETVQVDSVRDPHSYRIWTDAQSMFLFGSLPVMRGLPRPVEGRPVWAEIHNFNPSERGDFADNGDWLGALPCDVSPLIYDGLGEVLWMFERIRPAPIVDTYSHSERTSRTSVQKLEAYLIDGFKVVNTHSIGEGYFRKSPDENGSGFYVEACRVEFGSVTYASLSEVTDDGNRFVIGSSQLVSNDSLHNFIGVINE